MLGFFRTADIQLQEGAQAMPRLNAQGELIVEASASVREGENHIGSVMEGMEERDSFARPNDATPYAAGDALAAATSDTATTPLRGLTLARVAGGAGYITYWRITVNHTTFLPRIRVHLYTVAAPTTALNGDNAAFTELDANQPVRIGHFDLPNLALSAGAGSDVVRASRDDLRLAFKCDAADTKVYYRYEVLDSATPAALKTVRTCGRSEAF